MTDPAIIEAAERALDQNVEDISTREIESAAIAVLAAVTPRIEATALEKAAKVADDYYHPGAGNNPYAVQRDIVGVKVQPGPIQLS